MMTLKIKKISDCPKFLLNGPCGGVHDNGMCELSTPEEPLPCVWIKIFNRLKEQGKADEFLKLRMREVR